MHRSTFHLMTGQRKAASGRLLLLLVILAACIHTLPFDACGTGTIWCNSTHCNLHMWCHV
jgi:hypothetical protein